MLTEPRAWDSLERMLKEVVILGNDRGIAWWAGGLDCAEWGWAFDGGRPEPVALECPPLDMPADREPAPGPTRQPEELDG
jgi:hypothetical protein